MYTFINGKITEAKRTKKQMYRKYLSYSTLIASIILAGLSMVDFAIMLIDPVSMSMDDKAYNTAVTQISAILAFLMFVTSDMLSER